MQPNIFLQSVDKYNLFQTIISSLATIVLFYFIYIIPTSDNYGLPENTFRDSMVMIIGWILLFIGIVVCIIGWALVIGDYRDAKYSK